MHLLWPSPYPYPVTKNCVIIPVKIMDDNNPSSANSDQVYEIWEAKKHLMLRGKLSFGYFCSCRDHTRAANRELNLATTLRT